MHIPDGILPAEVALGGYLVTGVLTGYALRRINRLPNPEAAMPKAALLTAAFFVASWIHLPLPPTSVHLVLNGLLGVVLGWYAIPAILVGLFLQAVMFQHGGLTTLGVNTAMMGAPALVAFSIFQLRDRFGLSHRIFTSIFAFLGGALGLGLSAFIAFALLIATIPAYIDIAVERSAITALTLAHLPLALIEGLLTVMIINFLLRVQPELVNAYGPAD